MPAQEWVYGLSIYFIFSFIIVTLFSMAGSFSGGSFSTVSVTQYQKANSTVSETNLLGIGYSWKNWFKDVFSFFVWNISITETGIANWLWLIRIILVYFPAAFLLIAFYYSLPTVSGG